jgi:putative endonuclease
LSKGYEIVARNWRTPQAEIDIVAAHEGYCVFVEVRSRTDTKHGHPLETICQRKKAQIIRAARLFMATENPPAEGFRFDVIAVIFSAEGDNTKPEFVHLENAFQTDF